MAKKPEKMRFTVTVDRDVFDKIENRLKALKTGETVQSRVRLYLAGLAKDLDPKRGTA